MNIDSLGDRLKKNYEDAYRVHLPRRTNVIVRLDMKSGHSYTKYFKRPFDDYFMEAMDETAIALCEEVQNVKLCYQQSDELSLWLAPYETLETEPYFDNNLQKIVSVTAGIAAANFNKIRTLQCFEQAKELNCLQNDVDDYKNFNLGVFDSRAFIIPELAEVANYYQWRSNDCSRNSIQMVARSLYSHQECENKSCEELQEMTWKRGNNWNDLPPRYKRGRIVIKEYSDKEVILKNGDKITCNRGEWVVKDMEGYNFDYWFSLINKLLEKKVDKIGGEWILAVE
jgi:tRNA(His) guanylyltransferase